MNTLSGLLGSALAPPLPAAPFGALAPAAPLGAVVPAVVPPLPAAPLGAFAPAVLLGALVPAVVLGAPLSAAAALAPAGLLEAPLPAAGTLELLPPRPAKGIVESPLASAESGRAGLPPDAEIAIAGGSTGWTGSTPSTPQPPANPNSHDHALRQSRRFPRSRRGEAERTASRACMRAIWPS